MIRVILRDDSLEGVFDIQVAESLEGGLRLAQSQRLDIILLDLNLPDSNGFETFKILYASVPDVPVIVLTSSGGEELAWRAVDQGAQDFLYKHRLDPYWAAQSIRHAIGRHNLLQRLKEAEARELELARSANRAKTEFLATMSHEIRTPIGAVLMASDILRGDPADPSERLDLASMIHRNGEHLLKLVSDFLDLSKIEVGSLSIVSETARTRDLIGGIAESFAPIAAQKGLALGVEFGPGLPETLTTDLTRFTQILSNLLSNALKFTAEGQVLVRTSATLPEQGGGALTIEIDDTGIGISEEASRKLFRPYGQADTTIQRRFGGTGLGLLVSRRLASILGGSLDLTRTEPDRGCTFTLTIPLPQHSSPMPAALDSRKPTPDDRSTLTGFRVLLVDDNADNQRLVSTILKGAGAEVTQAGDGIDGIEAAMREHFDVVLMDIQMPRMNGDAATRELRARGYRRPIVALSADGFWSKESVAAGCDMYVLKPVEPDRLIKIVAGMGVSPY